MADMFIFVLQTLVLVCSFGKLEYAEGFDHHHHSARIIQGTDVNIKDFPYYAGLTSCGAAIVSESWVVTAAHCVTPAPSSTVLNYVWVGGESYSNSRLVTSDKVVLYNKINHTLQYVNDIALLHLSEPLKFTKRIRPVDLPSEEDVTWSKAKSKLVLVGRGLDGNGEVLKNLQKIDLVRLSTKECLSYMPLEVQERVKPFLSTLEKAIVCAMRPEGNPGPCRGDSGGPLVRGNTLVGITSFTGPSCEVARLAFYVNVANYVPWIKSVTGLK